MKHLQKPCLWASLLLLASSAPGQETAKTNQSKETTLQPQARTGMEGAYSMLMQIANDGTRDSILNVQQFKIYTDQYFMYAHALPGDSLAVFGIGTYRMAGNRLLEYPFYTASGGAHNDTFDISITKLGNGYVQVINFPPDSLGRKTVLTEEYGNVSTPLTSPLDGAWKQTRSQFISKTGTATTVSNPVQYKVFQSGHFMWASTILDSATQKPVSTFGYGTFTMNSTNKATERTTNSTFRTALIGKPVPVQLKFTGNNTYQQTIEWPTGRSVEEYQRLKQ